MSQEQGPVASIISLGRLINYGAKMRWEKDGAFLTLPSGTIVKLSLYNNCPHANEEVVKEFEVKEKGTDEKKGTRENCEVNPSV